MSHENILWSTLYGHEQWPNFKFDLDQENDNILKNSFHQRILQVSNFEIKSTRNARRQFFFIFSKLC